MQMTMQKYRKKPTVVEAIQFTGKNMQDILAAVGNSQIRVPEDRQSIEIKTLEGTMTASKGDFIVRGIKGELYPVKPDIFEKLHEVLPSISELAIDAAASYRRLPAEKRKAMNLAQRKSWVVGDLMIRNPHMSREAAEALFEKIIF